MKAIVNSIVIRAIVPFLLILLIFFVAGCHMVENAEDWVDLGLLWATRNVGAHSHVGYGDYFAWGETSPQKSMTGMLLNYRY